jgi:hypothetical protein
MMKADQNLQNVWNLEHVVKSKSCHNQKFAKRIAFLHLELKNSAESKNK